MTKKKSEKCNYFDGFIWEIRQNYLSLQQNEAGKSFPFFIVIWRETKIDKVNQSPFPPKNGRHGRLPKRLAARRPHPQSLQLDINVASSVPRMSRSMGITRHLS